MGDEKNRAEKPRAIVLLSGGLDSATTLAIAQDQGYTCYALSFNYGQRHQAELEAARRIATSRWVVQHRCLKLNLNIFGGSALIDENIDVPKAGASTGIPVTYVPARNTIFLSLALAWAEVIPVQDIFIGVNAVDFSGYPDCRPVFIDTFEKLARVATKAGVEGHPLRIHTPLIELSKEAIIERGLALEVDYSLTVSCYQADAYGRACGVCDACHIRRMGFERLGVADPTRYV